jgi:hypothetical protein
MCHHVDMDIDWEEAITEQDTETLAADTEEPELDAMNRSSMPKSHRRKPRRRPTTENAGSTVSEATPIFTHVVIERTASQRFDGTVLSTRR